jgi:membrane fusion protein (multidrug efflux system)
MQRGVAEKRRRPWLRYLGAVVALAIVVAALAGVKFKQIKQLIGFGEQMQAMGPPPESVGSTLVESKPWESTLSAVGSIAGEQSVQVAAEAPGTVKRILFDSGSVVKNGQVLVELDASTESAQLQAATARKSLAQTSLERAKKLLDVGAIPRAEYDTAATQLATAESDLASLRAQIARKVIRAPFAGKTGIRAINLGQYLAPGAPITTIESLGGMYVDFSLPQEDLGVVAAGNKVRVAIPSGETVEGTIAAVDPTIDPNTRNIKLRAHVGEHNGKLRSGMYVTVQVVMPQESQVVAVPQTAVVHATYGNSVFVIEDKPPGTPGMAQTPDGKPVKIARQQFVKLGTARGDFIAILEGVKAGQHVVSEGAFKLRNNAPVIINNAVKPKAELDPKPENR